MAMNHARVDTFSFAHHGSSVLGFCNIRFLFVAGVRAHQRAADRQHPKASELGVLDPTLPAVPPYLLAGLLGCWVAGADEPASVSLSPQTDKRTGKHMC